MTLKQLLPYLSILLLIFGCNSKKYIDPELYDLTNMLSGTFSSKEQSQKELGYADLNLVNVPIWQDKPSYWLYSEIYQVNNPTKIYVQRILNIQRLDSTTFKSTAYIISDAENYKNGWKDPKTFNNLSKENLEMRDGCDVLYKRKTSSIYVGKTNNLSCLSKIKNVAYTISNIVLSSDQISVWDRGYDVEGKQVWGKLQGAYKYKRIK